MSTTRAELADRVVALAQAAGRRILVGLAGAPGVGKSTVAEALLDELATRGTPGVVLPMDGFHVPQARLVELGRRDRMGAPDTFDVDGFVALLETVRRSRRPVPAPLFDRGIEEPVPAALVIPPEVPVVVVEGNYLLHDADGWERVAPLLDLAVYLHLEPSTRRKRLIARHIAFGKTADAAAAWALGPDERNARLVASGAERAHIRVELD